MAETDPVSIVVEIIDQFSDDLQKLRAELERIDAMDLDINLDIRGDGEIESVKARLEALEERLDAVIDVKVRGAARAEATLQALQRSRTSTIRGLPMMPDAPALPGTGIGDVPALPAPGGGGAATGIAGAVRAIGNIEDPAEKARRSFRQVGRALNKFRPNIMQVWNVLAALIPILITLGAAAIGLAGGFIALATAGAAVIGLGLLGWGDSLTESLENAQEQARLLAQRLHDVIQPAAQTFQPILEDWMQGAPAQVQRLVGPMQDLAVFAETLSDAGTGFVTWLGRVIDSMVDLRAEIHQITLRFGEIAGNFLIRVMRGLVRFAHENQRALISLSESLGDLISALLDVSVAVSFTLSMFSPLIDIIEVAASLINTKFGIALLTLIGSLLAVETALGAVFGAIALVQAGVGGLAIGIVSKYLPAVTSAIGTTWAWVSALSALQKALVATGVGALLVGGGIVLSEFVGRATSPPQQPTDSQRSGNTFIRIEGDAGKRQIDRLIDRTHGTARQEMSIQRDMEQ